MFVIKCWLQVLKTKNNVLATILIESWPDPKTEQKGQANGGELNLNPDRVKGEVSRVER